MSFYRLINGYQPRGRKGSLTAISQEGLRVIIIVTQPSHRKVGVGFKRVGGIEVVKRSVKSYVMILSGRCAVVGGIFATALS